MAVAFNMLDIDVPSYAVRMVISRLRRLKSTIAVKDTGEYTQCSGTNRVFVDTLLTEDQLEDWLYRSKGVDYEGTRTRKNYLKSEGYLFDQLDATPIETEV